MAQIAATAVTFAELTDPTLGGYDRIKARLVAAGIPEDRGIYEPTSTRTDRVRFGGWPAVCQSVLRAVAVVESMTDDQLAVLRYCDRHSYFRFRAQPLRAISLLSGQPLHFTVAACEDLIDGGFIVGDKAHGFTGTFVKGLA
jgi:hypothetical protein